MLTKRIIPCLDVEDGKVVKGIKFQNLKTAGDPVELARFYNQEGADELVFLDIIASYRKRKTMVDMVERVARQIFIPFTVGGGIASIEDIKTILLAGADKVSLNTTAVKKPEIITSAARKFGNQCIVLAIDAKKEKGKWKVFINGGRTSTGLDAVDWAKEGVRRGAGEILLTSMDNDGTEKGYDIKLVRTISEQVSIPVIASGGAGKNEDFLLVFTKGKADAALAASVFHFGEIAVKQLKSYLKVNGVAIRGL